MPTLLVGTNTRQYDIVSRLLSGIGARVYALYPSVQISHFLDAFRSASVRAIAIFFGTHPDLEREIIRAGTAANRESGGKTKVIVVTEERVPFSEVEFKGIGVDRVLRFPSLSTDAHITLAAIELAKQHVPVSTVLGAHRITPATLMERERSYLRILEALLGHYREILEKIDEECATARVQIRGLDASGLHRSHWDRVCHLASLVYSNRLEEASEEALRSLEEIQRRICEMRGAMRFIQTTFDDIVESMTRRPTPVMPAPVRQPQTEKWENIHITAIKNARGLCEIQLGPRKIWLPRRLARLLRHMLDQGKVTHESYKALGMRTPLDTLISELRRTLNASERGLGRIIYCVKNSGFCIDQDALESVLNCKTRETLPPLEFSLTPIRKRAYRLTIGKHSVVLRAQLATIARLLLSREGFVSYREFEEAGIRSLASQLYQLKKILQNMLPEDELNRPLIICGVNTGYRLNHVLLRKLTRE